MMGQLNVYSILKLQGNSMGFLNFAAMCWNLRPFGPKNINGTLEIICIFLIGDLLYKETC